MSTALHVTALHTLVGYGLAAERIIFTRCRRWRHVAAHGGGDGAGCSARRAGRTVRSADRTRAGSPGTGGSAARRVAGGSRGGGSAARGVARNSGRGICRRISASSRRARASGRSGRSRIHLRRRWRRGRGCGRAVAAYSRIGADLRIGDGRGTQQNADGRDHASVHGVSPAVIVGEQSRGNGRRFPYSQRVTADVVELDPKFRGRALARRAHVP